MSIQAALRSCLTTFDSLIAHTQTPAYTKAHEVPTSSWLTQQTRLLTWSSNVHALASGTASLDHLLRDPPRASLCKVRDHIPGLLGSIESMIKEILEDDGFVPEEYYEKIEDEEQTLMQVMFECVRSSIESLEQYTRIIPGSEVADGLTRSRERRDRF